MKSGSRDIAIERVRRALALADAGYSWSGVVEDVGELLLAYDDLKARGWKAIDTFPWDDPIAVPPYVVLWNPCDGPHFFWTLFSWNEIRAARDESLYTHWMAFTERPTEPVCHEMCEAIEAHPGYMTGFYDAADLTPIHDDAPAPYRAGWEAYWRCRELLGALERRGDGDGAA